MTSQRGRKEVFYAQGSHAHSSPIPEGVKAGGFVFLSALRGVDPKTQRVEADDMEGQARQLFENAKTTLAAAGAGLGDIVKVAVYVTDVSERAAFNKVWAEYFPQDPPARFLVQVLDMGVPGDKSKVLCDITALAP